MHLLVTDTIKKRLGDGSENQSVSGVTTIFFMQRDTSSSHRVDKAIDCDLWNVVPLLFNGYWRELHNAVIHVDVEHPKHAQWVLCLVSMQSMEELGHFQLPGIVYRSLRHGAMHFHSET